MGLEVFARLLPGLVVIVGGLLAVRWYVGRGAAGAGAGVRVVGRAGLTRNAVVAVIETGGRRFLVGAGEQGVALLGELETEEQTVAVPDRALALAVASPLELSAETAGAGAVRPPDTVVLPPAAPALAPATAPAPAPAPATPPSIGPRTGPLDRLRAMTVRTAPQRPFRAHVP